MESRQIEYILKIAEKNNITKAAEELFLTQPALNQQLIKVESELGMPLFHRSRNNWHLTEAGEIYVEAARQMLHIKQETYRKIQDLSGGRSGHLSVGFTAGRGINMFTRSYSEFRKIYPNLIVEYKEGIVRNLQALILKDELDVGFLTLTPADKLAENVYETIYKEEIFLAVPSGHPLARQARPEGEEFATLDISDVRYEPFVLMDRSSTMRTLVNRIFRDAGIRPNLLFETGNNLAVISMVQSNLACGLLAAYYVREKPEGVTFFRLTGHPTWEFVACHKKSHYLGKPAKYYIYLMKQQWKAPAV